ncbi:MAG: hypothetical protein ACON5F_02245 [Jejuia sp.]
MKNKLTYKYLLEQVENYQRNKHLYTTKEQIKILKEIEKAMYEVDSRYLNKF